MIFSLMSYDEERDEFFMPGIDDMPVVKKEEKNGFVMSYYDVYDDDYETTEDEVKLKVIIEMGNQPKSVYLTYDQLKKNINNKKLI